MATACKTCGGPVNRVGNYYVCEYCRNKWEIDSGNDVHAVERANAWAALRDSDFEKAAELFEEIIVKEANNHEAYWGRALAQAGIVYVTDLSENKKVPTCNNITEESFIKNKDVQKAISLAPADIADGYKTQAEYIDKVRVEWLEKASKEPAYDVFISFKDSDRENGIERTQDSIDAQDLYNALVADGYKVFFSRISLRDKISEQYEPYIYNAIKTAKVMIVFGEKPEYFSSVWIKNEWSRFKTRIEKGEKHKNSLVVVYKNMNPGDLPVVLKSRQCLNAADMTFLSDLTRHIKRVVEESKRNVTLEKIEITGGQIAKRASKIENETLSTKEIGVAAAASVSITEKQQFDLVKDYCQMGQWESAEKLNEDILFDNLNFSEALWQSLLIKYKVKNDKELTASLEKFVQEDIALIDKVLSCAEKDFAEEKIAFLYDTYKKDVSESVCHGILTVILPFDLSNRAETIEEMFKLAIEKQHLLVFDLLLMTLKDTDVTEYIEYNLGFAKKATDIKKKLVAVGHVLKVDEGNLDALKLCFKAPVVDISVDETVSAYESLLKYSPNVKESVVFVLREAVSVPLTEKYCEFLKRAIQYYPGELGEIKNELLQIAGIALAAHLFEVAEYFANLVLSFSKNEVEAYRLLCLAKAKSVSFSCLENPLDEIPEHQKYLSFLSSKERKNVIWQETIGRAHERKKYLKDYFENSFDCFIGPNGTVIFAGKNSEVRHHVQSWRDIVAVEAGSWYAIGLKKDGAIVTYGTTHAYDMNSMCNWRNIVAIHADLLHAFGIKSDGTVIAIGRNEQGECNVQSWRNIIAIKTGLYHTVGLRSDGTVVAVGKNKDGQCNVRGWRNIIAIAAAGDCTVGVKSNGEIVFAGKNYYLSNIKHLENYVDNCGGDYHGVFLKIDGTVIAVGNNDDGQCNVENWTEIVAIAAGGDHTVGLKSDGTVVSAGRPRRDECDVEGWENIIAIGAGDHHTVGLKSDGTVVATGDNKYGQCNVNHWKNIVAIDARYSITVGLKADGTVVATGANTFGACNVQDFCNVVAIGSEPAALCADGTILSKDGKSVGKFSDYSVDEFIKLKRASIQYQQELKAAQKKREEYLESIKPVVAQKEQEISELRTARASLGLFAGKKKKEIDEKIAGIQAEIKKLRDGNSD